jgi:tRNA(His) 5'-end guanylyltransferase
MEAVIFIGIQGTGKSSENELLWHRGINFNDLPLWQRRGTGLYWESYQKTGTNPLTQEVVTTSRRRLKTDLELPMKDDYGVLVRGLIDDALSESA